MVKPVDEAVADYESMLREWAVLNRRFEAPGANPHHGTTRANRLAKKMGALAESLGNEHLFRERLTALLDDADSQVRASAAAHALAWNPSRAEQVLIEIEQLPGLVSLGAKYTLKRYREQPRTTVASAPRDVGEATSADMSPELERLFDDVWMFYGAAMNGGFVLAFATAGHLADRVRDAFDQMKLSEVAAAISSGVRLFPGGRIPEDETTRTRLIDQVIDAEELEAIGDEFTRLIPSDEFLDSRMGQLAARSQ